MLIVVVLGIFYCSLDHVFISSTLTADAGKSWRLFLPVNVKYLCEESDPPAGKLPHCLFNGDFLMLEGEHDTA